MKVTIFNLKGGQGKTTLSLTLALLYGFVIVTNDEYSPIEKVLPKNKTKHLKNNEALPNVPPDVDLIYDFGGHPDKRVMEASKESKWVIVPIIYESALDMQVSIKAIREIEKFNKNIIIVISKTQKGDFEKATEILSDFFQYPAFEIKKSSAFTKMVDTQKSIKSLMNESYLFSYHYRKPLEQIEVIKNYIFKE
jgi:cellulose biosynthesis protein BcsQ